MTADTRRTDTTVQRLEPQPVLAVRQTAATSDLPRVQGESLHELWRLLQERGQVPTGHPYVRYHAFGDVDMDIEVGVPVGPGATGGGRVARGDLPGGRALVAVHHGAHDRLADAYRAIERDLPGAGTADGAAWEVYEWIDLRQAPDPSTWPAPSGWRTQVVQPII